MKDLSQFHDIMLPFPLDYDIAKVLLFVIFVVHLTLVLLMIGTAILAAVGLIRGRNRREGESDWGYQSLRGFVSLKSLAVVFGVGPILLMQMAQPLPFLSSVNALAPYWMGLVILISSAFYLIDSIAHHDSRSPRWRFKRIVPGLILLLSIPAVFVAVLVGAENMELTPRELLFHWILRYFHIIGASLVLGSLFQYFFSTRNLLPEDRQQRRENLLYWAFAGTLLQVLDGVALYMSLPMPATPLANGLILLGATIAIILLWRLLQVQKRGRDLRVREAASLGLLLILPMLGARQVLQDSVLVPQQKQFSANAAALAPVYEPFRKKAVAEFRGTLNEPQKGATVIYMKSCAFCHGVVGNGQGPDAGKIAIPPQDLTTIRFKPQELRRILLEGVPGSAMPPFNYYTKGELEDLTEFLNKEFSILRKPKPVPIRLQPDERVRAQELYAAMCVQCHGEGGRPTPEQVSVYQPPPPDFTQQTFEPERMFQLITDGYPGTAMGGNQSMTERERWAMVEWVGSFYQH
ncbi:MAG TPA: hypothetical protein DCS07_03315 [Bdellovibrionales bacterium]|nr:MAG: hypothetical protein A2Z97_03745 [Bdellovibrionales bacterium GWB1_52_6]OFZ06370.1 MAG: hypothetical protein A2X97_02810 [Bdellovibrionales bacterium GWA1_52_35]OFZ38284.1 MAG: hypothetical protein A2070_13385 [Bdellovibrionales bacterium GWC1_52_8]HAR41651.1 hypothetical protein [Bdellovibrionales bacterium]HCM40123.1 hypothetical protein [Bdellovibrionales bacterium]